MTPKVSPATQRARHTLGLRQWFVPLCVASVFCLLPLGLHADQVVLQSGDRLNGQVLALTTNALVFQSDVLGKVSLPRNRVTRIAFVATAPTNGVPPAVAASSAALATNTSANSAPDLATVLRQLGSQTNLVQQVQAEQLSAAGPEAQSKFRQLVGGLMTGRLTVADIRGEARSAADQLRELRKDLGPEVGDALDGYLAILDNFLQETAPAAEAPRSPAAPPPKPALGVPRKEK